MRHSAYSPHGLGYEPKRTKRQIVVGVLETLIAGMIVCGLAMLMWAFIAFMAFEIAGHPIQYREALAIGFFIMAWKTANARS